MKSKRILFVVTSSTGDSRFPRQTGLWLSEFTVPYRKLTAAGFDIVTASPKGGRIPVDPVSMESGNADRDDLDFYTRNIDLFLHACPLDEIRTGDFDAVFYPGGHGPLWDLAGNPDNAALVEKFYAAGKPTAAVCHGPAGLIGAKINGVSILHGKHVTGFSNDEEKLTGLSDAVPFRLESGLIQSGGIYSAKYPWCSYVVRDGQLITGQNPQSASAVAELLLRILSEPDL